ncbi:hypothetical protein AQS8620_03246 [Aquimixticola soesokkakensis]|uniref:DUF3576 domain-containing protein n=1 Tax=Aquimixticola soesokkakensis TaxID=1519096 RepID=A0A1Y5TUZ4_9RHOB|nr:DUF3576 domain-containing protein [Aquimixticola soesokkakensis]SLN68690.1 hypothetical protein AQS8620_03246 [Aquimixticola soesokkakensis]
MVRQRLTGIALLPAILVLGGCSLFSRGDTVAVPVETAPGETIVIEQATTRTLLGGGRGAGVAGAQVDKYIWNAAIDVLGFLPIQSADPFTGVIITGFGTPPGGGRAYRATVHVTDPALDARALSVAIYTSAGPVDAATQRAVEDAILTRARQIRTGAANL